MLIPLSWSTFRRGFRGGGGVGGIGAGFEAQGFGLWALEERATGEFVGFTGLAVPEFEAHFTPAVEVGWRLARSAWGNGYATDEARTPLAGVFGAIGLTGGVSCTP